MNFLFAISVGGFLVYDIALRTQWKERYFALVTEANALKASKDSTDAMIPKLVEDWKRAVSDLDQAKLKQRDLEIRAELVQQIHV